jgi:hypothetical protein
VADLPEVLPDLPQERAHRVVRAARLQLRRPSQLSRGDPQIHEAVMDWLKRLDEIFPRDGSYIEPLSDRWWQARRGRLTSSSAPHVIAPFGARGIATLVKKLRAEMEPGWKPSELDLPQLRWGRKYERAAIASIELQLGIDVEDPGTVFHAKYPFCSATPDGRAGGTVFEVKCPHNAEKHLKNIYDAPVLKVGARGGRHKWWWQMQWEAWCDGAHRIVFASFDPQQPLKTRLRLTEVPVDFDAQDLFEKNVIRFKNLFETGRSDTPGTIKPIGIPELF